MGSSPPLCQTQWLKCFGDGIVGEVVEYEKCVKAMEGILEALESKLEGVRLASVHALREIPRRLVKVQCNRDISEFIERLFLHICSMATDMSSAVRQAAFLALAQFPAGSISLETVLLSLSKKQGKGNKMAREALRSSRQLTEKERCSIFAAGAFVHGLDDEFFEVRLAALDALSVFAQNLPELVGSATLHLVNSAIDDNVEVRIRSMEILLAFAKRMATFSLSDDHLDLVLSCLHEKGSPMADSVCTLLGSLTFQSDKQLKRAVGKLLEASKKDSTQALLESMAAIGSKHSPHITNSAPHFTQLLKNALGGFQNSTALTHTLPIFTLLLSCGESGAQLVPPGAETMALILAHRMPGGALSLARDGISALEQRSQGSLRSQRPVDQSLTRRPLSLKAAGLAMAAGVLNDFSGKPSEVSLEESAVLELLAGKIEVTAGALQLVEAGGNVRRALLRLRRVRLELKRIVRSTTWIAPIGRYLALWARILKTALLLHQNSRAAATDTKRISSLRNRLFMLTWRVEHTFSGLPKAHKDNLDCIRSHCNVRQNTQPSFGLFLPSWMPHCPKLVEATAAIICPKEGRQHAIPVYNRLPATVSMSIQVHNFPQGCELWACFKSGSPHGKSTWRFFTEGAAPCASDFKLEEEFLLYDSPTAGKSEVLLSIWMLPPLPGNQTCPSSVSALSSYGLQLCRPRKIFFSPVGES